MLKIKSDKIIIGESLFDGYLYTENGKITEISKEDKPADISYDYTGKYLSPGFIEMHSHGAVGCSFTASPISDIVKACNFHLSCGATSICPTISSNPFEIMKNSVIEIAKAKTDKNLKGNIIGAHLEGPYFSLAQAGAQNPDFITEPIKKDYEDLIENYGDAVARWSYAPERDVNGEFSKYLVSKGVISAAGHTDAIGADMQVAFDNGCNLITHLYSGTSTITRDMGFRRLGVIESAYLNDDCYVEIIADGKHLPPELIKLILKIKGTDKVALITDSLEVAGLNVTEGVNSSGAFIVEDGVCKLPDRRAFAGSIATADRLIRVLVNEVGVSIPTAVKMMTKVPAEILKLNKGELAVGKDADLIVFDGNVSVTDVFVAGEKKI